eukprot:215781_1
MATSDVQKPKDTESKKSETEDTHTNDFLKSLNELQDTRALNLLINILSKIIQDPNDKGKQDLNFETIRNKIGDCKAALTVLFAIGFQQYTNDTSNEANARLKIDINSANLPYIKYVYNEILYKYCGRSRQYRQHFNCQNLMKAHPPKFQSANKKLVFQTICPNRHKDCTGNMVYSRHQLISLPATIPDPTDFIKNKLTIQSNIFEYVSNAADPKKLHFYVNFADPYLFGFYRGDLFAQDEIMTTEHPILGSLLEKIEASYRSTKDSTKLTPRFAGAVVILNAIKHGHFSQEGLGKIYGNRFQFANKNTVLDCVEVCKPPIIDNIICIASLKGCRNKYKKEEIETIIRTAYCGFNAAKSESMYQTLKKLRPRNPNAAAFLSECNNDQLLWILKKTVLTEGNLLANKDLFLRYFKENEIDGKTLQDIGRKAFGAALVKYAGGNKKICGPSLRVHGALHSLQGECLDELKMFDEYTPNEEPSDNKDQDDDEKKEKEAVGVVDSDMRSVVLHTGNWGCGAFGGNVELHFILQTVAAVAAGVDEMYFHSVDDKGMVQAVTAQSVLLNEILPNSKDKKGKFKRDLFINQLLQRGYRWGTPNGT